MGYAKEMWMGEVEKISEDLSAGVEDRDGAIARLRGLRFTKDEAAEMVDAAIEQGDYQ